MSALKKLLRNKVAKNAGWLICGRIIQMLINFFVGIYTARFLGPADYGLINYAGAYTGFFASVCTLGINSVIVKELVDNHKNEGTVLGTSMLLKAISSILSAVSIFCIVFVADNGEPVTIAVVALCSLGMIFNLLETFNYWFQSRLESKITAIATLAGYMITAAYKVFLIVTQKSVVFFALATSLDYIVVGIILICFYKAKKGQKLRFSPDYGKKLLKSSWHFILPAVMVSVYGQTDKFMLKQMISDSEIGYYSTATALCTSWCFVLQAIIDSFYPTIMEDYKAGNLASYERKNKLLYALTFYISAFVSVFFCFLAHPIIRILYGDAFLAAVSPLQIITWYTAFSYLGVARNAWIVCENRQKYLKWVYGSAAVSNVLINLLLIPPFGASGAAAASLIAQVITTMIAPAFIPGLRSNTKMMVDAIFLKGIFPLKKNKPNGKTK